MAKIITSLSDFITYLNTLYNSSSDAPVAGEEDYTVWTSLANTAVNLWENEEGILWAELFSSLSSATDGDKTTTEDDYSYTLPTNFRFSASGYVWLGDNTNKTAYKVIRAEDAQILENDLGNWCYFLLDGSPTLEFNPNITMLGGSTINFNYYKHATKLTTGTDTFEMADPMFAVYFALAELKKEEGNNAELQIASQKLESMKVRNIMPTWFQEDSLLKAPGDGFAN